MRKLGPLRSIKLCAYTFVGLRPEVFVPSDAATLPVSALGAAEAGEGAGLDLLLKAIHPASNRTNTTASPRPRRIRFAFTLKVTREYDPNYARNVSFGPKIRYCVRRECDAQGDNFLQRKRGKA